jgi:hypothetical protein
MFKINKSIFYQDQRLDWLFRVVLEGGGVLLAWGVVVDVVGCFEAFMPLLLGRGLFGPPGVLFAKRCVGLTCISF